jgi:hypothetical protein
MQQAEGEAHAIAAMQSTNALFGFGSYACASFHKKIRQLIGK